jgi:flagellar biosynthesis GTPase FlhF
MRQPVIPAYAHQPAVPAHTQPERVPAQPASGDARAEALVNALIDNGVSRELAASVVSETISHALPFGTPRQLKRLVREALARRIDAQPYSQGRRRTLAIVGAPGAGKTQVASRLAAAYHEGGDLPVRLVALEDGAELASKRVWPTGSEGIAVVDTPAVSPIDGAGIAELAGQLAALDLDEVHVALPATLSKPAAEQMLDALAPLGPTHIVLTHGDQTSHVGPALSLAAERGIPFSFVNGSDLEPANANDLAKRLIG